MPVLYLFLIGLFTSLLCGIFLYVSIHEMRRLKTSGALKDKQPD